MSKYKVFFRIIFTALFVFSANAYIISKLHIGILLGALVSFFLVNCFAGFTDFTIKKMWLKFCDHGTECLHIFSISVLISFVYHTAILFLLPWNWKTYLFSVFICILAHIVLFWNGMISVYCTSVQLGIKQRVIGAICGPIPIVHLFILGKIIKITSTEVKEETQKDILNRQRKDLQICKTKYPILMVHGVFFRDSEKLNYWGRIPTELEKNGATLFYGEHQSALSIEESAKELANRIRQIVHQTGCEKVNIIAHSKGGLDCRYAIANTDIAPWIASLTTINTPHRGCGFADYLLEKIPTNIQNKVAGTYNAAARKLGDTSPDFMEAVRDLTANACKEKDEEITTPEGIYCQSFGSILSQATHGKFPMNFSYPLVKYFDGANDGLVSAQSFSFGENYTLLTAKGKRGISHADMIDLNRENIPGFDVREFYVQLVAGLKEKGL